jgi:hypothetical protein
MFASLIPLSFALAAQAQPAPQYPVLDRVAAAIVQKYQTSSCQQLAAEKQAPPDAQKEAMKDRIGHQLQQDAAMRAALVSKVAAPVVDKMILCGFVP